MGMGQSFHGNDLIFCVFLKIQACASLLVDDLNGALQVDQSLRVMRPSEFYLESIQSSECLPNTGKSSFTDDFSNQVTLAVQRLKLVVAGALF